MNIFKSIRFNGWMWKTKITSRQNSWRDFEYFLRRAKFMRVISERKVSFMWKAVSCHASKEQFYAILKSLSKIYYKIKRWKMKTVKMNRSILIRTKSAAALEFLGLLQYLLCPVLLCICNGGCTRRRANKSKLKEVLLMRVGSLDKSVLASFPKDVLLVDLIALINTIIFELPSTHEELA